MRSENVRHETDAFCPGWGPAAAAKALCAGCPVRTECLEYALCDPDTEGVWGGTSLCQRRTLREGRAMGVTWTRVRRVP